MNKVALVDHIKQKTGLPKKNVELVLNCLVDEIRDGLRNGEKVSIVGFGTFTTRNRSGRDSVNPRTGKPMNICEAKVPVFRPSTVLKSYIVENTSK